MNLSIGVTGDTLKHKVNLLKEELVNMNFIDLDKNPQEASKVFAICVLGGDGFFLHAVHKFLVYNKPFYGVNYGTVGFLLNEKTSPQEILAKIQTATEIKLKLLKAEIETKSGSFKSLAMNEVTLFRTSGQVAKIKIFVNGKLRLPELASDGVVLSTASGSTAYNFSLHGPIFSPEAKVLSLCPISPFRPRHFRGVLLPENSSIRFEVMSVDKRPVLATTDFNHFDDVKSMDVNLSNKHFVTILFDKETDLNEKIIAEQFTL
jgi:NAD+ kinase